uniref:Uncharacterized protein n=1 Tax=Arundo donax TaxID=35708 RepID=A0A0A9HN35_ARUDO
MDVVLTIMSYSSVPFFGYLFPIKDPLFMISPPSL